jgi:hypothetical protein
MVVRFGWVRFRVPSELASPSELELARTVGGVTTAATTSAPWSRPAWLRPRMTTRLRIRELDGRRRTDRRSRMQVRGHVRDSPLALRLEGVDPPASPGVADGAPLSRRHTTLVRCAASELRQAGGYRWTTRAFSCARARGRGEASRDWRARGAHPLGTHASKGACARAAALKAGAIGLHARVVHTRAREGLEPVRGKRGCSAPAGGRFFGQAFWRWAWQATRLGRLHPRRSRHYARQLGVRAPTRTYRKAA